VQNICEKQLMTHLKCTFYCFQSCTNLQ